MHCGYLLSHLALAFRKRLFARLSEWGGPWERWAALGCVCQGGPAKKGRDKGTEKKSMCVCARV